MRPRKMEISPGDKFGMLTVLHEAEKDSTGHMRYMVRCDCGKEYEVQRSFLFGENPKCAVCSRLYRKRRTAEEIVGKTINNWQVLFESKDSDKSRRYVCRCINCGTLSLKTKAEIKRTSAGRCRNCPPDYNFKYDGTAAIGTLPDGTEFMIDREDVLRVSRESWRLHKGYIVTDGSDICHLKLHSFLIGAIPDGYIIDHANRNRLDCRKSNLRLVTPQQNSMNRSIGRNNTSGFVGACYDRSKHRYKAKISLGDKSINLGYSRSLIECAQMYNIAADLLFGRFRGHVNDVPEPSEELRKKIIEKCRPYMTEAFVATQSCGLFLCAE